MSDIRTVGLNIIANHAYEYSPYQLFELSSGLFSPHKIDCSKIFLHPFWLHDFAVLFSAVLEPIFRSERFHIVAGVMTGCAALAPTIALKIDPQNVRGAWVWPKGRANKPSVELGAHAEGWPRAVVVEDVTTTGASAMAAVEHLQALGKTVVGVAALVDREEGAAALFAKAGIPFYPIYTLSDVLKRRQLNSITKG